MHTSMRKPDERQHPVHRVQQEGKKGNVVVPPLASDSKAMDEAIKSGPDCYGMQNRERHFELLWASVLS